MIVATHHTVLLPDLTPIYDDRYCLHNFISILWSTSLFISCFIYSFFSANLSSWVNACFSSLGLCSFLVLEISWRNFVSNFEAPFLPSFFFLLFGVSILPMICFGIACTYEFAFFFFFLPTFTGVSKELVQGLIECLDLILRLVKVKIYILLSKPTDIMVNSMTLIIKDGFLFWVWVLKLSVGWVFD